jgi:uncharacterized protein (DUF362 family)
VEPDRRDFLRLLLAGGAALLPPLPGEPRAVPPGAVSAGATGSGATASEAGPSTVGVVRTVAHPTHRQAVREAVRLAGGLSFVRSGQRVLLKPALNSERRCPATTDPETVLAVAELVREAGGVPFVADRTMLARSTDSALRRTGMSEAAAQIGMPCLALDDSPVVTRSHPLAGHWGSGQVRVYRAAALADHVVSLCTPRSHRLAGFTMSVKNLVGVVHAGSRLAMHFPVGFGERLAEVALAVPIALAVMDGREGFADGGPDEGSLVRPGFVSASRDPVALDAVGLAFLRLAGANEAIARPPVWSLPVLRRAAEIGLGAGSADRVRLAGLEPADEAAVRAQLA